MNKHCQNKSMSNKTYTTSYHPQFNHSWFTSYSISGWKPLADKLYKHTAQAAPLPPRQTALQSWGTCKRTRMALLCTLKALRWWAVMCNRIKIKWNGFYKPKKSLNWVGFLFALAGSHSTVFCQVTAASLLTMSRGHLLFKQLKSLCHDTCQHVPSLQPKNMMSNKQSWFVCWTSSVKWASFNTRAVTV